SGPGGQSAAIASLAPSPSPAVSSLAPPAPSPLAPLTLVDYSGRDFIEVRTELRGLQLGVQLIFGGDGASQAVDHTVPPAGTPIDPGITVKVYVRGAAPLLVPPDVVGHPCNDAGRELAAAGVYPRYPTGRGGTVTAQDPAGGASGVHWNDTIRISCGPAAPSRPGPSQPG
ncbi:MAG: penicillin-binding protein, partial [Micromonosporaceae bacterium]|nr:penicillin-binding protein [Micromonosporaceae bacterium]